jgi:hypothetical protein
MSGSTCSSTRRRTEPARLKKSARSFQYAFIVVALLRLPMSAFASSATSRPGSDWRSM